MRGIWSCLVLVVVAGLSLPTAANAQQTPAGADFQVNSYTTGTQTRPEVHYKAGGDFVVAWPGVNPLDGGLWGIIGQRYDAAGTALGGEFKVNTFTTSHQYRPRIASDSRGNFVVAWSSYGQDGSAYGVFGQRFDAAGGPLGAEFQVNTYTTGGQGSSYYFIPHGHDVAMAPNGRFVVVWASYSNDQDGDGGMGSVQAQRFDASGAPLGGEFRVNTFTTGYEFAPSVAVSASGAFVVVWTQPDGGNTGVAGQRFDANGAPLGAEFQVNTNTAGNQLASNVAMKDDGSFLVVWSDFPGDMFGRTFDANGTPLGSEFQVNTTHTDGNEYTYRIGQDKLGNFVVMWNGSSDGSSWGVHALRFTAAGVPRGAEFQVNAYTAATQAMVAVASDDVGNLTAAWFDSARDGGTAGIFGQRFGGLRPAALAADAAGNGVFEPGETVALAPSWLNINGAAQTFDGVGTSFSGPSASGVSYLLPDADAVYGTVANGATAQCSGCYQVGVTFGGTRPATHWDATFAERITPDAMGQTKPWAVHVGESFSDVPSSNPFYRFVETLLHKNITVGCGTGVYCPANPVTREQMAVFVLAAKEGQGFAPPACSPPNLFDDVPETSPFCRWIEELANRGVVHGCGTGVYCPTDPVTREQMGVFISATFGLSLYGP
jgi:hypothetical protein